MNRTQRLAVIALAVVVGSFGIFTAGYSLGRDRVRAVVVGGEEAAGSGAISKAYSEIIDTAVDPPSAQALTRGAIRGMIEVLRKQSKDPYAFFYSPEGYRSLQELTTGQFSGIGVWLKEKDGELQIVSVLPETPALAAGLQRGDTIVRIDGRAYRQISSDEAVALIKGRAGTSVDLDVRRDGEMLSFEITRKRIDLPNLQTRITDDGMGYIRLFGFARKAGEQVRAEVDRLLDEGVDGLILDLRDNGGGLFQEAVEVASVFIEEGEIVTYRDATEDELVYEAEGQAYEDVPLVVLVNEGTASASEIVAGALQDRDRAVLIGTTTYGKGSVQGIIPLPGGSAVKFTTAAYFTPNGRNISGQGIDPDVEIDADPDAQLARAKEVLEGLVVSITGAQG